MTDRFKLIVRPEADLPDEIPRTYQHTRRHVLEEFVTVVESGVEAGEFRPADPRTAAFGVIGMLNRAAGCDTSPFVTNRVVIRLAEPDRLSHRQRQHRRTS